MSYLYAQQKYNEIKEKIRTSFDYLMLISIPLAVGIIGVSRNFVPWFFGSDYEQVIPLLYAMAPIIVVITISNILGSQYLTPSGQRVRSSKAIIIGAVVNFVLNAVLIPFYGAMGATIASVIAEFVISAIYMYMSVEVITWSDVISTMWKRVIASLIMLSVLFIIEYGHTGSMVITLLQVLAGVFVYAVSLILLNDVFLKHFLLSYKNKICKRVFHGSN